MRAVDLFAGPGGWDEGLRALGIHPLGIEWDDAACRTREAAGHRTLQADVAALDPRDFSPCELLIGSPPCQAFSTAGKRDGHRDVPLIHEVGEALMRGEDLRAEVAPQLAGARSLLVVEPLRWTLALEPTFVACEQVPPVLPLWETFAGWLRSRGYSTWAGILHAEQYGVPQTRARAILMASRAGNVSPPVPTRQKYMPARKELDAPSLFDAGARGRIVRPGEEHLLPWISMAEALGWTDQHLCAQAAFRHHRGAGMLERYGERPDTPATDPAPAVTTKARTAKWVLRKVTPSHLDVRQTGATPRPVEEPAPTMLAEGLKKGVPVWRHALNAVRWVGERPAPTVVTTRRSKDGIVIGRQLPEGEGESVGGWTTEHPTTKSTNGVRVQLHEAAILQGFPPDYPFQGSRAKRLEQVGNAVPPPLARAVVEALLATAAEEREAA